jgi:5'-3' exonuclease
MRGAVDWVLTEDADALVFGARFVVRGITTQQPVLVALDDVLASLGLSEEKFVDMCLLMGSDFTPKARGFGPVTSHKLVKKEALRVDALLRENHVAFSKWSLAEKDSFLGAYLLACDKFMAARSKARGIDEA